MQINDYYGLTDGGGGEGGRFIVDVRDSDSSCTVSSRLLWPGVSLRYV